MIKLVVIIQLLAGILLLSASLIPIWKMLSSVPTGNLRRSWAGLATMVVFFMIGYAIFGWLRLHDETQPADVVAALILFLGSCFVLSVSMLSCLTAKKLVRLVELERDVVHDPLTGVYNRRYLDARLAEEISRAKRYNAQFSVLLLDIDHFKKVNDVFGHLVGDEVIRRVAALVSQVTRPSDTVTRFGGEELLILAFQTDPVNAYQLAERIRITIEEDVIRASDGQTVRVTASIGVSSFKADDISAALIERADRALYDAKNGGRNRVCASGSDRSYETEEMLLAAS